MQLSLTMPCLEVAARHEAGEVLRLAAARHDHEAAQRQEVGKTATDSV